MLNVFITVDTEVWPRHPQWRTTALRDDYERDINGATPQGAFGVPYQIDMLNRHGLKAVFLVEGLFAEAVGLEPLRRLVRTIQDGGQEVQLHIHSEWLAWIEPDLLPGRRGQNIRDFTEDEQALLLGKALNNLRAAGASNVCAFRAGNYGANFDTLRALRRNGVRYDTSYNRMYLASDCGLRTERAVLQPKEIEGVCEFPITCFEDRPNHYRHAQLCACSSQELEHALWQAWKQGWYSFVLVSHSFELQKRRKTKGKPPLADRIVIRRFERLCRFLDKHRDKFRAMGFNDVIENEIPADGMNLRPLRSGLHRTAWRVAEQFARRVF